jgi:hypothetical protein
MRKPHDCPSPQLRSHDLGVAIQKIDLIEENAIALFGITQEFVVVDHFVIRGVSLVEAIVALIV